MFFVKTIQIATCYYTNEKNCRALLAVNSPYICRLQNTYPMHCSDTTKTVHTLICKTVISTVSGVLLPVYFRSNEVVHPLDKIHLQTYILLTAGTQKLNGRSSKI